MGLVYYLELVTEGMDLNRFNAAVALNWPANGSETGRSWCGELVVFVNLSQISAHNILIDHHITWHRPRLLRLPHLYDTIFQVCTVLLYFVDSNLFTNEVYLTVLRRKYSLSLIVSCMVIYIWGCNISLPFSRPCEDEVRVEVFMPVNVKIIVFWDITH